MAIRRYKDEDGDEEMNERSAEKEGRFERVGVGGGGGGGDR